MSPHPAPPELETVDAARRAALARALAAAGSLTLLPAIAAAPADLALGIAARRGGMPLAEALATRRSVRRYGPQPLTLAAAGQLLWAAQGLTAAGRRTAPSAGALYPLELHLVAARIDGLAPGAYRYLPEAHALRGTAADVTPAALQSAALGQASLGMAPVVVAITAVEARSAVKYGTPRAARYAAFEAGAAAQNLALQAVALGLASLVVGGFDDAAVRRALQLPDGEQPLVLMPVGTPA